MSGHHEDPAHVQPDHPFPPQVRRLTVAAREKKLATLFGNQRHANRGLREAVAVVKSGVIGEVKEAHSWIASSRGSKLASCNLDYSGPMVESVLLANIAYRIQGDFAWDALPLEASRDDATAILRREYRKGWEV